MMRVLITGGAGFIGSHLCEALVARSDTVVCADDLSTGSTDNISHLMGREEFSFIEADVTGGVDPGGPLDAVVHLASSASPADYLRRPLETLAAGSAGTEQALRIAQAESARFVLASTSEVYGDPAVHPQTEDYWGNVNPIGPRSVYDEAKRYAEAATAAYARTFGVNAGILRIFNTYGPRMRPTDGRVVTNFVTQALGGVPLTVYGDGKQTRSFCFVDDLVRGIVAMIDSAEPGPLNLGNPQETSVMEFARMVLKITRSRSAIEHRPLPTDDPVRRCPDISRVSSRLKWWPEVTAETGVRRTINWLRLMRSDVGHAL
jgi:dTDP-glucose 4,6-dehydratase